MKKFSPPQMKEVSFPTPHTLPPDVGGVGGATPCPQEKLFWQTLATVPQLPLAP
ncbi:hypothetical protein MiHa_04165 [Microcystis aeruginosa NIES-2522]|nr:hypothetical protein MiHa_04165 [Microcystis aeruginosa NIES-2522]